MRWKRRSPRRCSRGRRTSPSRRRRTRAWGGSAGARGSPCSPSRRSRSTVTDLLHFLESLHPGPLYRLIAALAAGDNVFPPAPADTAVALGAFLAGRGVMDPWLVFAVTWSANVGSGAAVYALARRHGRALFQGALGRRLFSDATIAHIEEQYRRHGTWG